MKFIRVIKSYKSKAYNVSLEKYEDNGWSIYKDETTMNINEAKSLAKEYISHHKSDKDIWIVTITKGTTYWGESADDFDEDPIYIICNKEDAKDIVENDYKYVDTIEYLK